MTNGAVVQSRQGRLWGNNMQATNASTLVGFVAPIWPPRCWNFDCAYGSPRYPPTSLTTLQSGKTVSVEGGRGVVIWDQAHPNPNAQEDSRHAHSREVCRHPRVWHGPPMTSHWIVNASSRLHRWQGSSIMLSRETPGPSESALQGPSRARGSFAGPPSPEASHRIGDNALGVFLKA